MNIHSLKEKEKRIVDFFLIHGSGRSSDIYAFLRESGMKVSLSSVKRILPFFVEEGVVSVEGVGPSTKYILSEKGRLLAPVDAQVYCKDDPDTRFGKTGYSFDLFKGFHFDPFSKEELVRLERATDVYNDRRKNLSGVLQQKELERFVIELSWKSSKIEGNTYTLLDTEQLILNGIENPERKKEETAMVLNHKQAFDLVHEYKDSFRVLSRKNMEDIHKVLVEGLGVTNNVRSRPVGVIGSRYRPLETVYQIEEAIDALAACVARMPNGYARALVSLLGISYIQPFEDGNKRTARLMANAILLASNLAPLSYRSVNEEKYREATLVFYELNSIVPFKKIFIEQYEFAASNYAVQ